MLVVDAIGQVKNGTRGVSAAIQERWDSKNFLDDLEPEEALELFKGVNREYGLERESADPDMRVNVTYGDSYDYDDDWRFGFLVTSRYSAQPALLKNTSYKTLT